MRRAAVLLALALLGGGALPATATTSSNRLYAGDTLVSGDRISVEVVGSGPDVVLIPGLASSRETWRRTADRLKGHYRLHIVQVNGFAGEPAGANASGPVTAPTVEAIDAYIRSARLKRPAIVGHSLGGVMALELALDHPADVSRVMIVDSLAFFTELFAGPSATVEGAKPYAERMSKGMLASTDEQAAAATRQMSAGMATADEDRARIAAWSAASNRPTVATAMSEDMLTDLRPRMAEIGVPVTVIYESALAGLIAADYAPVKVKTLVAAKPGAKHFIMFDDPQGFDAALDKFLAG